MKKPKNSIERFAYKLNSLQAFFIAIAPSFLLIVLICYMIKMSIFSLGFIITALILCILSFITWYIAILQTVYKIIKKYEDVFYALQEKINGK